MPSFHPCSRICYIRKVGISLKVRLNFPSSLCYYIDMIDITYRHSSSELCDSSFAVIISIPRSFSSSYQDVIFLFLLLVFVKLNSADEFPTMHEQEAAFEFECCCWVCQRRPRRGLMLRIRKNVIGQMLGPPLTGSKTGNRDNTNGTSSQLTERI